MFYLFGVSMAKDALAIQKKDEKKRAATLIDNLEIGKRLSEWRQKVEELLNIHKMEEKVKAHNNLAELRSGKEVSIIMGQLDEIVDLTQPKDDAIEVIEMHPIKKPFSYIRIVFDSRNNEYIYQVLEPSLMAEEQKIFEFLKDTLIKTMDIELTEFSQDEAKDFLRKNVNRALHDYSISLEEKPKQKIMYYIIRDFLGYKSNQFSSIFHRIFHNMINCDFITISTNPGS